VRRVHRVRGISRREAIGAVCWAALGIGVLGVFLRQMASLDPIAFAPISGVAVIAVFVLARRRGVCGILVASFLAVGSFI